MLRLMVFAATLYYEYTVLSPFISCTATLLVHGKWKERERWNGIWKGKGRDGVHVGVEEKVASRKRVERRAQERIEGDFTGRTKPWP